MYVLKTKGNAHIADYVQIRDEDFVLVNHCTMSDVTKCLAEHIGKVDDNTVLEIEKLPFGVLKSLTN